MVNMLEVLVANYCEQHRIALPSKSQQTWATDNSQGKLVT